jgi:hypothetical protein
MLLVSCQVASQARLRPAVWSPRVARFHSTELVWTLRCSVAQGVAELLALTRELADCGWSVHSVDEGRGCVVLNWLTPRLKWLDQARFRFEAYGQGCKVDIYAYSTGFLPLIVPFAPVLNCALFFVPFMDGQGACAASIDELRAVIARRELIAGTSVRRMSLSSTRLPSTGAAPEQLAPASDALGMSP